MIEHSGWLNGMMKTGKINRLASSSSILDSNEIVKYRSEGDKGYWNNEPSGIGRNNGSFVVGLVKLSDSMNKNGELV